MSVPANAVPGRPGRDDGGEVHLVERQRGEVLQRLRTAKGSAELASRLRLNIYSQVPDRHDRPQRFASFRGQQLTGERPWQHLTHHFDCQSTIETNGE